MNFEKINIEFSNMQKTILEYNQILSEIKNRIKNNYKDINKYEIKYKSTNSLLEKECYKLMISSIKNETLFLENLINNNKKTNKDIG